jgi:hypothetical protein
MIWAAWTLFVVGYLPGAALFRMPVADRSRREALEAGERVFWAVALSVAWSLGVAFVLALVGRYRLAWLLWANVGVATAIALAYRRRLRFDAAARPAWSLLMPAALAAVALWLYPPPSEYIVGGKDPGVYFNTGIRIAQRGSLISRDSVIAALPEDARELFIPKYDGQPYYSVRFMGFYVLDPAAGTVIDQFPHLYAVAVAVAYDIDGLTGARFTSVAAAILGVLALYFLAARLGGRPAGAVAAALLAIHVVQVWHARQPGSEILAQGLGLAGLLALSRSTIDDDPFFAPVAGVLLGLLPFVRFDAVLVAALACAGVALHWLAGGRVRAGFVAPLVAGNAAFGAYLLRWLTPYAEIPLTWLAYHRVEFLAGGVAGLLLAPIAIRVRRREQVRSWIVAWTPRVLSMLVVGLSVYAWFFRSPGGALAAHDAYAFRAFGWYVPPPALAAAVLGLVLLLARSFWRDPAFFTVFIGMSWFVFYRMRIVPEHFWASRRFLPIIVPGTMVALGALLAPVLDRRSLQPAALLRLAVRLVLLAMVGWSFWTATAVIRPHVEYGGVIPRLERLAARFQPDDLLIVESRAASDLHVLALPLAYVYAKHVLVLATPRPDSLRFAAFIAWARGRYHDVYFLGGGGTDLLSRAVAVRAVAGERFQIPEYESLWNAYPTHVRHKEFDFGIYRFVDATPEDQGVNLDIGTMDDLYVVRFHAKERNGRGTFRWTRDESYLSLLGISPRNRVLVLWMANGGRPPQAGPADVEAFLGTTSLGRVRVGPRMDPYTFVIPEALAAEAASGIDAATIRLTSTTWNPRALLGADDDRDLGVMVDRVEVRASPAER